VEVVPTHAGIVRLAVRWGTKELGTVEAATVPAANRGDFVETTSLRATFTIPAADLPPAGTPLAIFDKSDPLPPLPPGETPEDRGAVWVDRVLVEAPMKPHAGPRIVEPSRLRRRLTPVDGTPLPARRKPAPDPVAATKAADEVIVSTAALLPGAARL